MPSTLLRASLVVCALITASCRATKDPEADTFGLGTTSPEGRDDDGDGYAGSEDCNDNDAAQSPEAVEVCDGIDNNCDGVIDEGVLLEWFDDRDEDGFGAADTRVEACAPPEGHVGNGEDCDDDNDEVFPGAPEACDSIDNDCDGDIDEDGETTWFLDTDGDGFGDADEVVVSCERPDNASDNDLDCDDSDPAVNPDAEEVCNEVDDDCDDEVDEDLAETWYRDLDGDGWGDVTSTTERCSEPPGYTADPGDCDDDNPRYYPGAPETDCTDPNDYNCDGSVAYADADADGWPACTECDDSNPDVNPDAIEVCNAIDDDCDGDIDDADSSVDLSTGGEWYGDRDGDTYGNASDTITACDAPSGYVGDDTDCDDGSGAVNPGATEVCNTIDDDCDGDIDDSDTSLDTSTGSSWYADGDRDGYGDATTGVETCLSPSGYVSDSTDCDDSAAAVNPGATEVCNAIDDDCDGDVDDSDPSLDSSTATTWFTDGDGDGYGGPSGTLSCVQPSGTATSSTDCDDGLAAVNPGAIEVCNTIDDDCDGDIDDRDSSLDTSTGSTWYADADVDGYGSAGASTASCVVPSGFVADSTDCDDAQAAVNPGATEVCNAIDDDCDGDIDDDDASVDTATASTWYADGDGDGYGSASGTVSCAQPSGTATTSTDCDDGSAAVNPGATEVCNTIDDDCDGAIDDADGSLDTGTASTWYVDGDGDGYGSSSGTRACSQPSNTATNASDCDDTDAAVNPGAAEVCDGQDTDCDGSIDEGFSSVSTSFSTASPTGSCNGNSNRSVTFSAAGSCGCPSVVLTGSFVDNSDGSGGQLTSVSTSSTSMTLQWDDAPSGGDCDLDIRSQISWSAAYAAGAMTVTVTDSITGYDAGNSLSAGYSITSGGTTRRSSGSGSKTFTYSCP